MGTFSRPHNFFQNEIWMTFYFFTTFDSKKIEDVYKSNILDRIDIKPVQD